MSKKKRKESRGKVETIEKTFLFLHTLKNVCMCVPINPYGDWHFRVFVWTTEVEYSLIFYPWARRILNWVEYSEDYLFVRTHTQVQLLNVWECILLLLYEFYQVIQVVLLGSPWRDEHGLSLAIILALLWVFPVVRRFWSFFKAGQKFVCVQNLMIIVKTLNVFPDSPKRKRKTPPTICHPVFSKKGNQ